MANIYIEKMKRKSNKKRERDCLKIITIDFALLFIRLHRYQSIISNLTVSMNLKIAKLICVKKEF